MKFLLSLLCAFLVLTGCSTNNQSSEPSSSLNANQQQALDVVETYLSDFKEGKLVEADECLSSDLSDMQFRKMMDMVTSIYETLGMNSTQIKMVKNTLSTALAHLVQDYSIETVSADQDNQVVVTVNITGISVESLAKLQSEDLINAVSDAIGDSASSGQLEDETFQKALDTIIEKIDETAAETSQASFTVSKENDSWLISDTSNFGQLQAAPDSGDTSSQETENEGETIEESIEEDAAESEASE